MVIFLIPFSASSQSSTDASQLKGIVWPQNTECQIINTKEQNFKFSGKIINAVKHMTSADENINGPVLNLGDCVNDNNGN